MLVCATNKVGGISQIVYFKLSFILIKEQQVRPDPAPISRIDFIISIFKLLLIVSNSIILFKEENECFLPLKVM